MVPAGVSATVSASGAVNPVTSVSVGTQVSGQIKEVLSGAGASIVVRIYGPDVASLRQTADKLKKSLESVPGTSELKVEMQTRIPQIQVRPRPEALADHRDRPLSARVDVREAAPLRFRAHRRMDGDAAGVVTAVFQALQALHQHRHDVARGNGADDATHEKPLWEWMPGMLGAQQRNFRSFLFKY